MIMLYRWIDERTVLREQAMQVIAPVTHDLGGFKVHRTLPHKARTTVSYP